MFTKRILFVDDDPNLLQGLMRRLHGRGADWEMHSALSVDAALEIIFKVAFDAVISDVRMPGKDGFELLKTMQDSEITKDIPVIILTGSEEHSMKRRALEMGATDLLNKPVHLEDLVARLQSVLRLKAYQDQLKEHNNLLEQKVKERTQELENSRLDIILRLGKAAEYRDEETGNHILRVGCDSRILAAELSMSKECKEMIFHASPLHDIGKIGIPDSILLKQNKLTQREYSVMKRHCVIGSEILKQNPKAMQSFSGERSTSSETCTRKQQNPILEMASTIALTHHEKWDGSGYPAGLTGEEIPLVSRIVAIADVYDALRSKRPYKEAYSHEQATEIMFAQTVKHFDPKLMVAFKNVAWEFQNIYVKFSDETQADKSQAIKVKSKLLI